MISLGLDLRLRMCALILLCIVAIPCVAQVYPVKPMRFVVPFPPGGVGDIVARPIAEKLTIALGQTVVVESRAGASGTIGAEYVANAAPDGYTFLLGTSNELAMSPSLFKRLPYDPIKSFAPVTPIVQFPNVLVVGPSVKAHSLKELIDFARENPDKITFASSGPGSTNHLTAEVFKTLTGVRVLHVPYKGGGPALTDVMGGHIDAMFATLPSAVAYIKAGKLRALAVTGEQRSIALPEVPTAIEAGVPGLIVTTWNGVVLPAGTPASIIDTLQQEIRRAANEPEVKQRYAAVGAEVLNQSPSEFAQMIARDFERWSRVIREAGVTLE